MDTVPATAACFASGEIEPASHPERRRTIMAYDNECHALGYDDCTPYLRFSHPSSTDFSPPLGVPKGQYHAADNHSLLNENRTAVEYYR